MNFKHKMIASAITILGFSTISNAQPPENSATATAIATIVAPLVITRVNDMNFGNVAVSATVPGTVILAPAGGRTVTGGVAIVVATLGTVTAASFTITGTIGYTYTITLPTTCTLTIAAGAQTMTATTFTSTPTGIVTLAATNELLVGATLNVGAAQAEGVYSSASGTADPFTVTVNYN